MLNIDITHAPLLYGIGMAGLLTLAALTIFIIELRRAGSMEWPEWHYSRTLPVYRAQPSVRAQLPPASAPPSARSVAAAAANRGGGHPTRGQGVPQVHRHAA